METDAPDIVAMIREKTERLAHLREQVSALETELEKIRSLVSATDPSAPKYRIKQTSRQSRRRTAIQEDSSVWWALRILQEAREALPADELVRRIGEARGRPVNRPTLISSLSRYVNRKDTFVRPRPNTFGLAVLADLKEEE